MLRMIEGGIDASAVVRIKSQGPGCAIFAVVLDKVTAAIIGRAKRHTPDRIGSHVGWGLILAGAFASYSLAPKTLVT